MLATAITSQLEYLSVHTFTRTQLDITCIASLHRVISNIRPDYIINCAAYTAVDLAQSNQVDSYRLNCSSVRSLAQLATQYNAILIHFSTDYVFDGHATSPYSVDHLTNPINVYGASKLAGELAVRQSSCNYYIFRISWLYAAHGKNFFRWITDTDNQQLNIVNTQTGCPTSALDVAQFVNYLIHNDPEQYGLYHFSNEGVMTWYDFACLINQQVHLNKQINPISTFKTLAQRPDYSVLDTNLTERTFNYNIPTTYDALTRVISQYNDTSI